MWNKNNPYDKSPTWTYQDMSSLPFSQATQATQAGPSTAPLRAPQLARSYGYPSSNLTACLRHRTLRPEARDKRLRLMRNLPPSVKGLQNPQTTGIFSRASGMNLSVWGIQTSERAAWPII
jgi:hypothetical protein